MGKINTAITALNQKFFAPYDRRTLISTYMNSNLRYNILEVGVFTGQLASFFCKKQNVTYFGIDPYKIYDGNKVHSNKKLLDDRYMKTEKKISNYKNGTLIRNTLAEFKINFPHLFKTFDIIYIDGDHSYKAVKSDLIVAVSFLKKNGIIFLDDFISSEEYGIEKAVYEFLLENSKSFYIDQVKFGQCIIKSK